MTTEHRRNRLLTWAAVGIACVMAGSAATADFQKTDAGLRESFDGTERDIDSWKPSTSDSSGDVTQDDSLKIETSDKASYTTAEPVARVGQTVTAVVRPLAQRQFQAVGIVLHANPLEDNARPIDDSDYVALLAGFGQGQQRWRSKVMATARVNAGQVQSAPVVGLAHPVNNPFRYEITRLSPTQTKFEVFNAPEGGMPVGDSTVTHGPIAGPLHISLFAQNVGATFDDVTIVDAASGD